MNAVAAEALKSSADPLARVIAILGLAVAVAGLARGLYKDWRGRHRVEVLLSRSTVFEVPDRAFDYANVLVRNFGHPISVESVSLEWADSRPAPVWGGCNPPPSADSPYTQTRTPPLPYVLHDGEAVGWAVGISCHPDQMNTAIPAWDQTWDLRGRVHLSNGRTAYSNVVALRLWPWSPEEHLAAARAAEEAPGGRGVSSS